MSTPEKGALAKWWPFIIIAVVFSLSGGGFIAGKYYEQKRSKFDPLVTSAKLDSLAQRNASLMDTIRDKNRQIAAATKARIIYQTIYDTIRVHEVPMEIQSSLNRILSRKPE